MNKYYALRAIFITSLTALTLTMTPAISASDNIKNELIGAWQIGLDKYPNEIDEKQAFREGLLASIFYFDNSNIFKLYVPCGASEIPSLSKAPAVLNGNWELNNNTLTITVNVEGKSETHKYNPFIKNRVLTLSGDSTLTLGRYKKEVPPKCN